MSKRGDSKKVVEITQELYDRAVKLSKDKGISQREAMDLIAKGEQTEIISFFPNEFTRIIKDDLHGADRNKRVLAYQEIKEMADAGSSIHSMENNKKLIELTEARMKTEGTKQSLNAEREKTEKSKQDYYRSRDIDSQDRKEIRRIAQEERERLTQEKERGA